MSVENRNAGYCEIGAKTMQENIYRSKAKGNIGSKVEESGHKQPTSDCENSQDGYYFDKIYINVVWDLDEIKNNLPMDELNAESKYFFLRPATRCLFGYKTRIEIIAPTRKCLEILSSSNMLKNEYIKITSIEIAHDVFYASRHEAEYASYNLFRTIRKLNSWCYVHKADPGKLPAAEYQKRLNRGLFARQTLYSVDENTAKGTRKSWFKLVIYARYSKIDRNPCIHYEWRIKRASIINKRTGIQNISDLLNFDFETFFKTMDEKYIVHEEIDSHKIGKVLAGLSNKRKLTIHEKMHIDLYWAHFRSQYNVATTSDLARFTKNELLRLQHLRGPRLQWARKVEKLNNVSSYTRML